MTIESQPKNIESLSTPKEIDNITIIRPGGNDTALVPGVNFSLDERRKINDAIINKFSNVEQVGFYNITDPLEPILEMAGGEFCGNATRSVAYLALEGKPGKVSISVSGVEKPLQAGVDDQGDTWAEMPIKKRESSISYQNQYTIIELEGITQVIAEKPEDFTNSNDIKDKGYAILKDLDLLENVEAAGVMFIERSDDQIKMEPVVWVRDIQTLFYETACGSGTTAVGILEAISTQSSVNNLPIIQPTGTPIYVSVALDPQTKEVEKVIISGPVEKLEENESVNINREQEIVNTNLDIQQIKSTQELKIAIDAGLVKLYQDVFKDPPYNEEFSAEDVMQIFEDYVKADGLVYITRENGVLSGFVATVPLTKSSVEEYALKKSIPMNSWYMADLGVKTDKRRQRIATQLVEKTFEALPKKTLVILRTTSENQAAKLLYLGLEFEQLAMTQVVSQKRNDRKVREDLRIYLGKNKK